MKTPVETPDLTQFRRMLVLSGLWFPEKTSLLSYLQAGRLIAYLLIVLLWDWSLSRVPLHHIPWKSYTPIVIWSNFHFLTVVYLCWRSDQLRFFTDGMARLLSERRASEEMDLFSRLTSLTWKWIAASFGHVLLISLIISLLPTLVDVIFFLFSESKRPFYIPMTLEGFIEDTSVRSPLFYFLNITNGLLVIIPSVYYVALLTTLPATISYIYFELEVFKLHLLSWSRKEKKDKIRKDLLRKIIQNHAELLRLIEIMKELLGTSFSTQNFVSSINTGFLLHAAKKAIQEGDVMLIMQQVYFFSQLIGVTFLCCYIGEILHQKGLKVSQDLCELPWYEEEPSVRRDLLMVILASQRPIVFDFKKRVPLNLETFAELMNRAYTIFILLESLQ